MEEKNDFGFYSLKLVVVIVLIFFIQLMSRGFTDLFLLNSSAWQGEIWRFITPIFLHGGGGHLLYNMFALALFGSVLERVIGSKRFLIVFFITGIFANLLSVSFYNSSLGASGAIMGVIGALVIMRPGMTVWAFGMPMPMFIAAGLWAAGDVIGVFVPSNVANIAHLSGMGLGFVLGVYFRNWKIKRKNPGITISESDIRRWEDVHMR